MVQFQITYPSNDTSDPDAAPEYLYEWVNAGDPVFVQTTGPVTEPEREQQRDEHGDLVFEDDGITPVIVDKKDSAGNVITHEVYTHTFRVGGTTKDGRTVRRDGSGNIVYDADGVTPVYDLSTPSIAYQLDQRGFSAVPGIVTRDDGEARDDRFTGQVRVVMKNPMAEGQEVPVTMRLNGSMTLPLADYRNNVYLSSGMRTWNYASASYATTVENSETMQAGFNRAIKPSPTITATAIAKATEMFNDGFAISSTDARKQPIMDRPGAGWRFRPEQHELLEDGTGVLHHIQYIRCGRQLRVRGVRHRHIPGPHREFEDLQHRHSVQPEHRRRRPYPHLRAPNGNLQRGFAGQAAAELRRHLRAHRVRRHEDHGEARHLHSAAVLAERLPGEHHHQLRRVRGQAGDRARPTVCAWRSRASPTRWTPWS